MKGIVRTHYLLQLECRGILYRSVLYQPVSINDDYEQLRYTTKTP